MSRHDRTRFLTAFGVTLPLAAAVLMLWAGAAIVRTHNPTPIQPAQSSSHPAAFDELDRAGSPHPVDHPADGDAPGTQDTGAPAPDAPLNCASPAGCGVS